MKTLQGRNLSYRGTSVRVDNGAIRIQSTRDIENKKVKIEYKERHNV
jgi:hypothetical protein